MLLRSSFTDCANLKLGVSEADFLDISSFRSEDAAEVGKFAKCLDHLLKSYLDFYINEIDVPEILIQLLFRNSSGTMKVDSIDHGERYYEKPLQYMLLAMALANCPTTIDKLNDYLKGIIRDPDLLEDFLDQVIEVDQKTKMVHLRHSAREAFIKQPNDLYLLWERQSVNENIQEGLSMKLPKDSADPFAFQPTSTQVPRLLQAKLAASAFWPRLPDLARLLQAVGRWPVYLEAFLRALFFHVAAVFGESGAELPAGELEAKWESVEKAIRVLRESGLANDPLVLAFIKKIAQFRDMNEGVSLGKKLSSTTSQTGGAAGSLLGKDKDHKQHIAAIFERKSKKVLTSIRKKKHKFLENLVEETNVITKQLLEKNNSSGFTCCLSQTPLTEDKIYFQIGNVYPTNVGFAHSAKPSRRAKHLAPGSRGSSRERDLYRPRKPA